MDRLRRQVNENQRLFDRQDREMAEKREREAAQEQAEQRAAVEKKVGDFCAKVEKRGGTAQANALCDERARSMAPKY